jgi:hypothetical protein
MKNILLAIGLLLSTAPLHAQNTPTRKPWILRNSKITLGIGLSKPEKRYILRPEKEYINQTIDRDISIFIEKSIFNKNRLRFYAGFGYGLSISNLNRSYSSRYINNYEITPSVLVRPGTYTKHLIQSPLRINYDIFRWKGNNVIFLNGTVLSSICINKRVKNFPHTDKSAPKSRFIFTLEEIEFNPGFGFRHGNFEYLLNCRVQNFSKKDLLYFYSNEDAITAGFLDKPYEWHNPPKWWLTVAMCFGK